MRLGVALASSLPDGTPLTGDGLLEEARLAGLGFDDAVLVPRRASAAYLAALRALPEGRRPGAGRRAIVGGPRPGGGR